MPYYMIKYTNKNKQNRTNTGVAQLMQLSKNYHRKNNKGKKTSFPKFSYVSHLVQRIGDYRLVLCINVYTEQNKKETLHFRYIFSTLSHF